MTRLGMGFLRSLASVYLLQTVRRPLLTARRPPLTLLISRPPFALLRNWQRFPKAVRCRSC